jgi:hypothetical protein
VIIDKNLSEEWQLDRDIRRAIILSNYIKSWGIPEYRTKQKITLNKEEDSCFVEVYTFPPLPDQNTVYRIATIGISDNFYQKSKDDTANYELMMALPANLGNASLDDILSYFVTIVTSTLASKNNIKEGFTLVEGTSAPKEWKLKSILLDTPVAESEELECFNIGLQSVNLYIALPIYKDECNLIRTNGIETFDNLCEASELSAIDLSRDSFLSQ